MVTPNVQVNPALAGRVDREIAEPGAPACFSTENLSRTADVRARAVDARCLVKGLFQWRNPPNVFHALDQGLAAAVAAAAPSVVHVSRGHGRRHRHRLVRRSRRHLQLPHPRPHARSASRTGRRQPRSSATPRSSAAIPGTDIALLRVAGGGLTPAKLRELDGLAVGNLALAIGRPGRTARASLRAIGVLGPEVETPARRHARPLRRERPADSARVRRRAARRCRRRGDRHEHAHAAARRRPRDPDRRRSRRVVAELQAARRHSPRLPRRRRVSGRAAGRARSRASRTAARPRRAGVLVGDILVELDGDAITGPDILRSALGERPGKR